MGFLENAKDAVKLVQQIDNIELYEKIIALKTEAISMIDEQASLKEENRNLKAELEAARKSASVADDVEFVQGPGFYIRKSERDAGRFIPYCPVCWAGQSDKRLLPLNPGTNNGLFKCDVHKSTYRTEMFERSTRETYENINSAFRSRGPGSWMG